MNKKMLLDPIKARTVTVPRLIHAMASLFFTAALLLGGTCRVYAFQPLDVFIPAHPPVVAPGPDVPAETAKLAGAWQGVWNDGTEAVLLVRRIDADTADLLLAENRYGDDDRLPWHLWARARVDASPPAGLKWKADWASFAFRLSPDGQQLTGVFDRFNAPEEEKHRQVTMTRRPVEVVAANQLDPPMACRATGEELRRIQAITDPVHRRKRVDELVQSVQKAGAPLLEDGSHEGLTCATFLYRGPAKEVALAGVMNGFNSQQDFMTQVAGTDLFFISQMVPSDARIEYRLAVDGRQLPDPLNPRILTFGKHMQISEAAMPDYLPPSEIEPDASATKGTTEELPVASRQNGWSRTVTAYLPHGYADCTERYPVLYLNDGFGAMNYGKVIPIMDNLIARKEIPPLIVVLVPSAKDRMVEYRMNPVFESFFIEELIPAVEARFRTLPGAENRAIGGISAGATAALSLALHHPDVFGKCIAQSTATEVVPLLRLARKGPERPITTYLEVGSFEVDFYGRDLVDVSRRLRDALRNHGCQVRYEEVNEGHGWFNWRSRTRDAVRFLFSTGTAVQPDIPATKP